MILEFKKLKVKNFMSFDCAEINLSGNQGFVSVIGENNNKEDLAASNGSGKSAIWEALSWGLTGATIRGNKKVLRNNSDGECIVSVEFMIDSNQYEICRYGGAKSNLTFFVNGENKSGKGIRDTTRIVSEYLPNLTANLLGSVVIMGQGLPARFSNNSPSGRKEVLEKLVNADYMIEDLKKRVNYRLKTLKNVLDEKTNLISSTQGKIDIIQQSIKDATAEITNFPSSTVLMGYISAAKEFIAKRKTELESHTENYSELLHEKESALTDIRVEESNALQATNVKYQEELEGLRTTQKLIAYKIQQKQKELKDAESVIDVCPYCKQKIPDAHKIDTTEIHSEIFCLEVELNEVTRKIEAVEQAQNGERQKILNAYAVQLTNAEAEVVAVQQQSVIAQNEIDALNADIFKYSMKLAEYENQLKTLEETLEALKNKKSTLEKSLEDLTTSLVYNIDERDQLNEKITINNKFSSVLSREFRGIILKNIIDYIDERVKYYAKEIFENQDIVFALNGNDIDISFHGKEYESLSGGERQKVDLIVQFSLRDMLCQYMGFSANILVLDEITDNLDYIGCQKVLTLISNKLTDVENIFIISHRQDLDIPFDRIIKVTKTTQGVSSIDYVN